MPEIEKEIEATKENQVVEIKPSSVPPPPPPIVIPTGYETFGAEAGYNPLPAKDLRQFLIGAEGCGKTTFVAGIPRNLILDFEKGAWGVPYSRAVRIPIKTASQLRDVVAKLVADAKNSTKPFDRVTFDSIDSMLDIINPEQAEIWNKGVDITRFGMKGAGYSILRTACWDIIKELEGAGYAWTCIGHVKEVNVSIGKSETTVLRPVLFDSFAKQIARNCELFANIYQETETIEEKKWTEVQGTKIEVSTGKLLSTTKVYLDVKIKEGTTSIGTFQGKSRGVPTLRSRILLPGDLTGKYGWDTFVSEYNIGTRKVRDQVT